MLALIALPQSPTVLPVAAAYSEPDPNGIDVEGSTLGWRDTKQSLVWYGEAKTDGTLELSLPVRDEVLQRLKMTVGKEDHYGVLKNGEIRFGLYKVQKGPVRMALSTDGDPGQEIGSLVVRASGEFRATASARRNAASVHLRWPTPKDADVRWFYNEATMLTDPTWSYTMACGFARGYFGMQVNDPGRRCVIFSVWDAGTEAVSRDKVAGENRVQLVAKGEGVFADSFGNEGTGGHSHFDTMWRTGKPLRFLVGCRPEGDKTLYAGYWMGPGDKAWRLVSAFRAPKDGGSLRSLYSFSEDYVGANGQRWRESTFGHGWIGLADGSWQPLARATFTTDGHGRTERWDYDAFVRKGLFHLRHGGFESGKAQYGDALTLAKSERRPDFPLPELPR